MNTFLNYIFATSTRTGLFVAFIVFALIAAVTFTVPAGAATATPDAVAAYRYIEHVDGLTHILSIMQQENTDIPYTDAEKVQVQSLIDAYTKAVEAHDYDTADDLGGQLVDLARSVADRATKKAA